MPPAAPTRRDLLFAAAGLAVCGAVWPEVAHAEVESWDISYGVGPNLDALKAAHGTVSRVLGPGVARELVVVRLDASRYALVYRRQGDQAGARTVAARHARLLSSQRIGATPIASRGQVVFPASLVVANVAAPAPKVPSAPKAPPPSASPAEGALSDAIDAYVKRLRQQGKVASNEKTSWLVYDLAHDRPLASINGETPRQAASMIKPFVMLAFFHQVSRGRILYGPVSRGRLEAMIQRSSNVSTNWAVDQLGGPSAVHRLLHDHYGVLVPKTRVVERIGSGGRTYRNAASVADYGRYLRALWRSEIPYAKEQRRILALPNRDRIFQGAPSIPAGTALLDKTGSTSQCCGNMGIVIARKAAGGTFPYVFCGVIEKDRRAPSYGSWISARGDVIRGVSDLVYRQLKPAHGLV